MLWQPKSTRIKVVTEVPLNLGTGTIQCHPSHTSARGTTAVSTTGTLWSYVSAVEGQGPFPRATSQTRASGAGHQDSRDSSESHRRSTVGRICVDELLKDEYTKKGLGKDVSPLNLPVQKFMFYRFKIKGSSGLVSFYLVKV